MTNAKKLKIHAQPPVEASVIKRNTKNMPRHRQGLRDREHTTNRHDGNPSSQTLGPPNVNLKHRQLSVESLAESQGTVDLTERMEDDYQPVNKAQAPATQSGQILQNISKTTTPPQNNFSRPSNLSRQQTKRNSIHGCKTRNELANGKVCINCIKQSQCTRVLLAEVKRVYKEINDVKDDRDTWRRLYQMECRKIQIFERIKDKNTI